MEKQLHLLLADDDTDDRFFFTKALKEQPIATKLTTIENGEKLMQYLAKKHHHLPDALFLDLNMPRKNGSECLLEIKHDKKLKILPVIIYSTSLHEDVADILYEHGAHYYIRKTEIPELKKILQYVLVQLHEQRFVRPKRNKFILNAIEV